MEMTSYRALWRAEEDSNSGRCRARQLSQWRQGASGDEVDDEGKAVVVVVVGVGEKRIDDGGCNSSEDDV
jgi:hypothetical protein